MSWGACSRWPRRRRRTLPWRARRYVPPAVRVDDRMAQFHEPAELCVWIERIHSPPLPENFSNYQFSPEITEFLPRAARALALCALPQEVYLPSPKAPAQLSIGVSTTHFSSFLTDLSSRTLRRKRQTRRAVSRWAAGAE